MEIILTPVGFVQSDYKDEDIKITGKTFSVIKLNDDIPLEALKGIEDFSHLEIIWYFHKKNAGEKYAVFPRGNKDLGLQGIFATRSPLRPNHIATTIVKLIGISGRLITVYGLDALNDSPVLDIKPVTRNFLPAGSIRQPGWVPSK